MNPTNKPLAIELGGKRYHAYFDLNTFAKFEEITKTHFLEFLASMQEALSVVAVASVVAAGKKKKGEPDKLSPIAAMDFLRKLSIRDLQAFVYSAVHEYDAQGEPVWPLTVGQMGRLITTENMVSIVSLVMRGNSENSPSREDLGPQEVPVGKTADPTRAGESAPAGGADFGPSDDDALASLTLKSAG